MQQHLTVKALVSAAHAAAPGLPPAAAQLMRDVASRLDVTFSALCEKSREVTAYEATVMNLTAQVQGLAVENAQMLRLLTDISENHGEFVNEDDDYMYASVPLDYVSEINMYVSRDVNAENPFEHTDATLAEIRAQGVEMFIGLISGTSGMLYADSVKSTAADFAHKLRKEQGND